MKRAKTATSIFAAALLAATVPAAAFAMPGDIEEAVTEQGTAPTSIRAAMPSTTIPNCWRSKAITSRPRMR